MYLCLLCKASWIPLVNTSITILFLLSFLQQKLNLPIFSLRVLLYRRYGLRHHFQIRTSSEQALPIKCPAEIGRKHGVFFLTVVQGRCIYAYIHVHMCSTAWVPATSYIPRTERGQSVLVESTLSLKSDQERVFKGNMGALQFTCPIQTWPSWWKARWLCNTAHAAQSCPEATLQARTNSRLFFPPV